MGGGCDRLKRRHSVSREGLRSQNRTLDLGTWQHPGLVSVHKGHRTQEKLLFQKVKARDAFK